MMRAAMYPLLQAEIALWNLLVSSFEGRDVPVLVASEGSVLSVEMSWSLSWFEMLSRSAAETSMMH